MIRRKNKAVISLANNRSFARPLAAALILTLASTTPLFANAEETTDDAQPSKTMPTVVVKEKAEKQNEGYQSSVTTIGKFAQAAKDIPQSLTIVTRSLMDDRNADTFKEALRNVAGLTFNAGEGGRVGDNITIRGFAASSDFYLDGIRDNAQYNRDTFNLDRIEVLQGAASMLFGRGSTGGVVNQVSKEPDLDTPSKVTVTTGSHAYFRETADINQNLGTEAAIRLNLMKTNSDSQRGADGVTSDRYGVAPEIKWGIGTDNEYLLSYSHLQYDDVPDNGIPIVNAQGSRPAFVNSSNFYGLASDFQDDKADIYTGRWTHDFDNDHKLKTTFRQNDVSRDLDSVAPRISSATVVTRGRQARGADEDSKTFQSDYTAKFETLGMKHEALLGTEYLDEKALRWSYPTTPADPNANLVNPNPYDTLPGGYSSIFQQRINPLYYRDNNLGLYGQDLIEFIPHWKLLVGARWDDFSANYKSIVTSSGATTFYDRQDYVWSYRSGLMYQPDDYSTYYASYGTAFNPSGDVYSVEATQATRSAKTAPEESINYELGGKWELLKGYLSFSSAIFRSEKTNERNTDPSSPDIYLLSGRRHTDGIQFQSTGKPTDRWEISAAIAFMKAEIDKQVNPFAVGLTPTNTPATSGSLWNTYAVTEHWKLGTGVDFVGKRLGYSIPTTTPYTAPVVREIPGYGRFDGLIEYDMKQYAVKLNLFNLLDKKYFDAIYPNGGFAVPGIDRSAQLTVSYKF